MRSTLAGKRDTKAAGGQRTTKTITIGDSIRVRPGGVGAAETATGKRTCQGQRGHFHSMLLSLNFPSTDPLLGALRAEVVQPDSRLSTAQIKLELLRPGGSGRVTFGSNPT